MPRKISKTQIDRLGDRLKKGNVSDGDLKLLEDYRRSFTDAYEVVVAKVREVLRLEPTGRPLKSTTSIIDKLRRETIRLSQMQDIAGCRVTARDFYSQEAYISEVTKLFETDGVPFTVADRRVNPSHGYRAVHIIAHFMDRNIEIQVRTELQHVWAELCEGLADTYGHEIKYGGGNREIRDILEMTSSLVAEQELLETHILRTDSLSRQIDQLEIIEEGLEDLASAKKMVDVFRNSLFEKLGEVLKKVKENRDISNSI